MKDKQISIPQVLFNEICAYMLLEDEDPTRRARIKKGLEAKIDRMTEHELYTTYKSAPTEEQREKARREYLDRKGISQSFRR